MARGSVSAVVVAAGRGARIAAGCNKLLLPLRGEPLIVHTLRALGRCDSIDELVLVTRPDERDDFRAAAARAEPPCPTVFTDGGPERADSVRRGVAAASPAAEWILIHDGARPFVTPELIAALLAAAAREGAAIPVLPVADTLKRLEDGRVAGTVDRAGLGAAQTPQAFRAAPLREVLGRPPARGHAPTDDAALFEAAALPVAFVEGDPRNFKVTRPADLELAEALLAWRDGPS